MITLVMVLTTTSTKVLAQAEAGSPGNMSSLAEVLVTAPDRERRLLILQTELQAGRFDTALDLLATLLAEPGDAFVVDPEATSVGSLYQQILETLRRSPDAFRKRWDESQSPVGNVLLERALQQSDAGAVRTVARRFVLTQTGLQAEAIEAARLMDRADAEQLTLQLGRIEETYGQEARFRRRFTGVRDSIQGWQTRHVTPPRNGLRTAEMFPSAAASASAPWPKPVWTWSQPIDDSRLMIPRGDGTALAAGGKSFQAFSNWQPLILHDSVVLRSPFQLVALHRTSGRVLWTMPTDTRSLDVAEAHNPGTAVPADPFEVREGGLPLLPPIVPPGLTDRAAFGMITADDDYLFFIDGFHVQTPAADADLSVLGQFQPRRGGGGLPGGAAGRLNRRFGGGLAFPDALDPALVPERTTMGQRLVALKWDRKHQTAQVAWVAGASTDFRYRVHTTGESMTERSVSRATSGPTAASGLTATAHNNSQIPVETRQPPAAPQDKKAAAADNPFAGHQFLTAPVSRGTLLFVITRTEQEQILNCLDRSSGRLNWRQSLIFDDTIPLEFLSPPTTADTATALLLHHDTIICSLANGTVICLRQADGTVEWARSLRDEHTRPTFAPYAIEASHGQDAVAFFSVKNKSVLIGTNPASAQISAINLRSGKVLWQVPRQAYGAGMGSASDDLYAAGIDDQHVILVGEQHCRSLDVSTGLQRWVVEISASTGRAWCIGDVCLIPEAGGQLVRIQLSTGDAHRVASQLLPDAAAEIRGSLTGDAEFVFASTPSSMTAFTRSDHLQTRLDELDTLQKSPARKKLVQAQTFLLDGHAERAVQTLLDDPRQLAALSESPEAQSFAAELILQLTAQKLFSSDSTNERSSETSSGGPAGSTGAASGTFSREQMQTYLQLLPSLPLNASQKQRLLVFKVISSPNQADWIALWDPSTAARQRSQISVDGDWRVRPRQLAWAELNQADQVHSWTGPRKAQPEGGPSPSRDEFADALLLPQNYGHAAGLLQLAERAAERNDRAAAEMLLLKVQRDYAAQQPQLELVCATQLEALRRPHWRAGLSLSATRTLPATHSAAGSGITHPGLSITDTVVVEDEPILRTSDSFGSEIASFRYLIDAPETVSGKWLMQAMDERNQTKTLSWFSLADGSCTDQLALKHDYQNAGADLDGPHAPGILLLSDRERLAAISCVQAGQARLLWETTSDDPAASVSRQMTAGPVGPDYLVWRSASRLHCTHPLTGHEIWSRQCAHFADAEQLFSSELLFGDEQLIAVLDPQQGGYRRYRTADGRMLKSGILKNVRLDGCITTGHHVLCTDTYGRILLMDLLTETNLLESDAAIFVAGSEPMFRQITDGIVVTVSNAQELVLIDTRQGRIAARLPIAGLTNTQFVFGLTAWQQNGRYYVSINDEQAMGQTYVAIPRMGEPRLNYGALFCVDPNEPRILWSRRVDPFVVAQVDGDACPLLLLWSHVMPPEASFNRGLRSQRNNRLLRVQVVNALTGQLLADRPNLQPAYPIRCTYDATRAQMQLFSHDSIITVTHTASSEVAARFRRKDAREEARADH